MLRPRIIAEIKVSRLRNPFRNLETATGGESPATKFIPDAPRRRTPEISRLARAVESLRAIVENDHQHRLEQIERDLRWVIFLLGAQLVGLIGAVASRVFAA